MPPLLYRPSQYELQTRSCCVRGGHTLILLKISLRMGTRWATQNDSPWNMLPPSVLSTPSYVTPVAILKSVGLQKDAFRGPVSLLDAFTVPWRRNALSSHVSLEPRRMQVNRPRSAGKESVEFNLAYLSPASLSSYPSV